MTFRALKRLGIANTTGQIRSLVVEQVPESRAPKTRISVTKIKGSQRLICGLYQSQSSSNIYYGERCDYNVR